MPGPQPRHLSGPNQAARHAIGCEHLGEARDPRIGVSEVLPDPRVRPLDQHLVHGHHHRGSAGFRARVSDSRGCFTWNIRAGGMAFPPAPDRRPADAPPGRRATWPTRHLADAPPGRTGPAKGTAEREWRTGMAAP